MDIVNSTEIRHFDALVACNGESWWGHQTAAGAVRLARRARMVAEMLPLGPNYHILEAAAGAGALTQAVLREAPDARITATDMSPVSVARLNERVGSYDNVEPEVADMTRLAYSDGTFDAVLANSALHHVDVELCFRQLHRVLRPGGRLLAFEPNLVNPEVFVEMNVARHIVPRSLEYSQTERTHPRWTYAKWLREAGFTEVRVQPFDFVHPLTPRPLIGLVQKFGWAIEHIPILREMSGSLLLTAKRP